MTPFLRKVARRFPRMQISTFIILLRLLVGLLGAGIITYFSLYFIYKSGEQSNLRELEDLAFITKNALDRPVQEYTQGVGSREDIETTLNRYLSGRPELNYTILSRYGEALLPDSSFCTLAGVTLSSPEVTTALAKTFGHAIRDCPKGVRTLYVASTFNRGSEVFGILILAAPFDEIMAPTYKTMRWMGVVAFLIVMVTVAEGWLASAYISRPLGRLSQTAKKLSQGNLAARAEIEGPSEVANLGLTLNEMAGRLQVSQESLRAFVANASHELRTPLTSVKLQVEALRNGACEDPKVAHRFLEQIEHEIDHLVYTVNEMLDLSQIEGSEPDFQPVNIADLAMEVEAFWATRSRQAGTDLMIDIGSNLPVLTGNPYQLRRLFDNLLENAMKNTPPGGTIQLIFRYGLPDSVFPKGTIRIEVRDTGRGIAREDLPHIFDRFYRSDSRTRGGGSGLGLAIARSIVNAHNGSMGVKSELGSGSTFWIELPVK